MNIMIKILLRKLLRGYIILEQTESQVNGKILVQEDIFGKRRLVVGGLIQSGKEVEEIWKKPLRVISNWKLVIRNCLILGFGAGSAAKLISRYFPEAKIVGVEIDSEIIRLGKKYFGTGEIKNLKVEPGDAVSYLGDLSKASKKFDLILVDLYLGDQVPEETEKDEFLENIKRILTPLGWVIFNKIYYRDAKEKTEIFGEKLKSIFVKVEARDIKNNRLFLCQTSGANKGY